jgi:hypothetical protein
MNMVKKHVMDNNPIAVELFKTLEQAQQWIKSEETF